MSRQSESGRSILEMIAVIALIILLTMGSLVGYQKVVAGHQASSLNEDILVQAQSQKGHNYRGKSTYDSGIGKKTRLGLEMTVPEAENSYFSIQVKGVAKEVCPYLNQKNWQDALRIKINKTAFLPNEVSCKILTQDTFNLEVLFPRTTAALDEFKHSCKNCTGCEECDSSTYICKNTCTQTQECRNNICVCKEGTEGDDCNDCQTNNTCESCPNKTPYWNGTTCVCQGTSCGADSYCEDGICKECGSATESCSIENDVKDDTTQCVTQKKITCTKPTPDCDKTSGKCILCDPPNQKCNISKNTVDSTSGCVTEEKISCPSDKPACFTDGQCHECPQNATCSEGTVQCNDGYTLYTGVYEGSTYKICCLKGYIGNKQGQCVCGPNSTCDPAKKDTDINGCPMTYSSCSGILGCYFEKNICTGCPINSSPTGTGDQVPGMNCHCNSTYPTWSNCRCTQCDSNSDCSNGKGDCTTSNCYCAYQDQSEFNNSPLDTQNYFWFYSWFKKATPGVCKNAGNLTSLSITDVGTAYVSENLPTCSGYDCSTDAETIAISANNICLAHGKTLFNTSNNRLQCYSENTPLYLSGSDSIGQCCARGSGTSVYTHQCHEYSSPMISLKNYIENWKSSDSGYYAYNLIIGSSDQYIKHPSSQCTYKSMIGDGSVMKNSHFTTGTGLESTYTHYTSNHSYRALCE